MITQVFPRSATFSLLNLSGALGGICRTFGGALVRERTRRVIADLSGAQLRDAGIDRSKVLGDKPVISVDVGVTTSVQISALGRELPANPTVRNVRFQASTQCP